jgi:polysaccharide export outer membrane protein
MRKVIFQALKITILLALVSCVSSRNAQLINLIAQDSPSATELVLSSLKPIPYKERQLKDLPGFILSFPGENVFSNENAEAAVNKGAIKSIRYEYGQSENQGRRPLNFVVVELIRDLPYKVLNQGNSLVIRIEHPEMSPSAPPAAKTNLDVPQQNQGKTLEQELGYLVGPGDVLGIEVWKFPEVSRDVVVSDEGGIRLPWIKNFQVMGMTLPQMEDELTKALSKYLVDPAVFVTIKSFNSQRVIALGETKTGMYPLRRRTTTLVEFLGEIGGASANGDVSRLKLIKKSGETFTYDLNDLIQNPQKSAGVLVSGGDTLYVPSIDLKKVYVLGQVNAPKSISIKGKFTLVDAISEAGGVGPKGAATSVIVARGEIGSQKAIRINLNQILKNADFAQNIELMAGDIVYVPKNFLAEVEVFWNFVTPPLYLNAMYGFFTKKAI